MSCPSRPWQRARRLLTCAPSGPTSRRWPRAGWPSNASTSSPWTTCSASVDERASRANHGHSPMTTVLGVDLGTQSTKVVVCDADSGEVLRSGQAPHPDATEVDPGGGWDAVAAAAGGLTDLAAGGGLLDGVAAIGVAGQQHGMVCLDERGDVVRPALLWNDIRSAGAAAELVVDLGGPAAWAHAVGSVPVASFTVSKLRWFARTEPKLADRTATVLLPHDWLTDMLRGDGTPTTDRGDASGTGYWSPAMGTYRPDLLELAFGRELPLPRVAEPAGVVGETSGGVALAAGTGDNMAAALGLRAGLTRTNASAANLARAAVEGLLCGLADGLDALRGQGVPVDRILLIGGGAGSAAVRALAPALLGAPVAVPRPAEYVALGAARQAAWALQGGAEPPAWPVRVDPVTAEPTQAVRPADARIRARATR